jgi:hypothetical protein
MDLKQDLPKLGKENEWGMVHFGVDEKSTFFSLRPNYAAFKNNKYNDEVSCVSVLVGLLKPNNMMVFFKDQVKSQPYKNEPLLLIQLLVLYGQLINLFKTIRENIDTGIATGEIGKVLIPAIMESQTLMEYERLNCHFSSSRQFNTLSFLSWMQENGHPIPEELAFEKSDNGDLVWIDRQIENQRTVKLSKETPSLLLHSTNPDERLEEILTLFKPDIEHFYKYLKRTLQKYKFESPDYPAIAEEAFDNAIAKKTFNYLSKNNFGKIFQTETLPTPNVRIKGYLAANMILSFNDDILLGIKDVLNGQNLLTKMNKLEKNA